MLEYIIYNSIMLGLLWAELDAPEYQRFTQNLWIYYPVVCAASIIWPVWFPGIVVYRYVLRGPARLY